MPVNDGVVLFDSIAGALTVTAGGCVLTVNVTGALTPAGLPSELGSVAIAVYWPSASGGEALLEVHAPPLPGAVAPATTVPFASVPLKIWIVTGSLSLAVPVNAGVLSLDTFGGALSVTVGEVMSTVNVVGEL